MNWVAFLRGINVGGNTKVPMGELKKTFESLEFSSVKTLLNSGNVVFTTDETDVQKLTNTIEEKLAKTFGFRVTLILRSQKKIQQLVATNPFKHVVVTPNTRMYITFTDTEDIKNTIEITEAKNTTDLMKNLEQKCGKRITTRNWNTVVKVEQLLVMKA